MRCNVVCCTDRSSGWYHLHGFIQFIQVFSAMVVLAGKYSAKPRPIIKTGFLQMNDVREEHCKKKQILPALFKLRGNRDDHNRKHHRKHNVVVIHIPPKRPLTRPTGDEKSGNENKDESG